MGPIFIMYHNNLMKMLKSVEDQMTKKVERNKKF